MMNNFCFHFYAQKSLFKGENDNAFLTSASPPDITVHRAGSQLKTHGIPLFGGTKIGIEKSEFFDLHLQMSKFH